MKPGLKYILIFSISLLFSCVMQKTTVKEEKKEIQICNGCGWAGITSEEVYVVKRQFSGRDTVTLKRQFEEADGLLQFFSAVCLDEMQKDNLFVPDSFFLSSLNQYKNQQGTIYLDIGCTVRYTTSFKDFFSGKPSVAADEIRKLLEIN